MQKQPYHHPDLREALIAATADLVESEGAQAVTIARVAGVCGVSVAAPYRHFRTKAALLGAVAGRGFEELALALQAAPAEVADPEARLIAAGVAYVDFAVSRPHLFAVMFSLEDREPHAAARTALGVLGGLIEDLDLAVSADVALRNAWSVVHGHALLKMGGMRTFIGAPLSTDLEALIAGLVRHPRRAAGAAAPRR